MSKYTKPMFLWNECVCEGVWATNLSSGNPDSSFSANALGPEYGTQTWEGGGQVAINIDLAARPSGNRIYITFDSVINSFWIVALNGVTNPSGYVQGCTLFLDTVEMISTVTIMVGYNGVVPPTVNDVKVKTE